MSEAAGAGPLAGRVAIVTGASRGIGHAVARALAAAGARVAMLARGADALREAARPLGAMAIACDVADETAVARTVERVGAELGAPEILVNNAGIFHLAPIAALDAAELRETIEINLVAPFLLVRQVLPAMRAAGRGHVVTIGSIADRATFPENGAYAATKFGARAMHQVLREELRGSGVRASLVSPGPVDTPLWDAIGPDARPGFTPRARMLDADAVADAVLFALTRAPAVNIDELRLSRA
ncbi:MAG TPA: SDR family oxidoreductase [Gemmatimonadaceae bacterium]|nr:SDR family oxidoreductase [Gemmatimonadaceae bacterium]